VPSPSADPAAALLSLVRDGDRLLIGTGAGEPRSLLRLLIDDVLPRRRGVELIQVSIGGSEAIASAGGAHGHRVRLVAGGAEGAKALRAGTAELVPASMGTLAEMIGSGALPVSGVLVAGVHAADGARVSPGLSVDLLPLAARAARFRALELNSALPATRSAGWISEPDCDLVLETADPPPTAPRSAVSDAQRIIGEHVAALIPDGAVLELGIGQGLQGVAGALLARQPRPRLAVHTGIISDDVQLLVESGVVTGALPCGPGASVVATVARGSARFYEWLDDHPAVWMTDSLEAHDPRHLSGFELFIAVNSASEIDLLGNVGAGNWNATLGGGGLPDFAEAGARRAGSVIALESRNRHGAPKIVPHVARVQLHATAVTHVVTEHGVAALRGATARDRAERILAIAHPADRERLRAALPDLL
jgi:acyl-CoA hydrolase